MPAHSRVKAMDDAIAQHTRQQPEQQTQKAATGATTSNLVMQLCVNPFRCRSFDFQLVPIIV